MFKISLSDVETLNGNIRYLKGLGFDVFMDADAILISIPGGTQNDPYDNLERFTGFCIGVYAYKNMMSLNAEQETENGND